MLASPDYGVRNKRHIRKHRVSMADRKRWVHGTAAGELESRLGRRGYSLSTLVAAWATRSGEQLQRGRHDQGATEAMRGRSRR